MKALKVPISNILFLFMFLSFLGLAEQSFAGFSIHVSGAVQSYKNDIYQVKTKRGLVNIQGSKLSSSLKKKIHRRIGRRIQMGIPSSAILSYKKTNRRRRLAGHQTSSKFRRTKQKRVKK